MEPELTDTGPVQDKLARSGSPSQDELARSGSPNQDELARSGSPSQDELARSGSPNQDDLARSGSPSHDELARSGSPSQDELATLGSPSQDDLARSGSPSQDELARSGSPSHDELARSGSPSPDELATLGSPSQDDLARSGSPSHGELARSGSPSQDELATLGSPSQELSNKDHGTEHHSDKGGSLDDKQASNAPTRVDCTESDAGQGTADAERSSDSLSGELDKTVSGKVMNPPSVQEACLTDEHSQCASNPESDSNKNQSSAVDAPAQQQQVPADGLTMDSASGTNPESCQGRSREVAESSQNLSEPDMPQGAAAATVAGVKADQDVPKQTFPTFHEISDRVYDFPESLEQFGYRFNQDGQLRTIEGDEPFQYQVRDSHNYNQQRYEALGELVNEYIYDRLEECGLQRHPVPNPPPKNSDLQTFIFASREAFQKERLLVLIHGSGMVRAGQWTRKLIINESVDTGSQLPYIKWGLENDYGVVVLNTNHNRVRRARRGAGSQELMSIPMSRTAEEHAQYVWTRYIKPSRAKYIAYVAHSSGGLSIAQNARDKSFRYRVFAVALTESLHSMDLESCGQAVRKYFNEVALNWITSDQPLDTRMPPTKRLDAPRVSAGTLKHEWTPHTARESVFKYINDRFEENAVHPFKDDSLCTLL